MASLSGALSALSIDWESSRRFGVAWRYTLACYGFTAEQWADESLPAREPEFHRRYAREPLANFVLPDARRIAAERPGSARILIAAKWLDLRGELIAENLAAELKLSRRDLYRAEGFSGIGELRKKLLAMHVWPPECIADLRREVRETRGLSDEDFFADRWEMLADYERFRQFDDIGCASAA